MEQFTYEPLADSDIRLARVTVNADGQLQATIEHAHLNPDDPIFYSCLSYVWGDQKSTTTLICNGKSLQITSTLDAALREVIRFNPNELLWIDQVCIDQKDVVDQSAQVKRMDVIFDRAKTVIAWLGHAVPSTPLAVDLISRVGQMAMDMAEDTFQCEDSDNRKELETVERIGVKESQRLGVSFDDHAAWQAFSDFFDRPWFQRVWIVQETLPAREAICLTGSHSVSWDLVKNAATWYVYKAAAIQDKFKPAIYGVDLTVAMNLHWISREGSEFLRDMFGQKARPKHRWSLVDLLRTFRPRLATDSKDKVYALLGLAYQGSEWKTHGVVVDYSKSVKQVYTETALSLINIGDIMLDGSLDLLLDARARSSEVDWPSWVPDWRVQTGYGCTWGIGRPLPKPIGYKVAGAYRRLECDDPFALKVEGVVVGKVRYTSPHHHLSHLVKPGNLREQQDTVLDLLSGYPTGEDVIVAFALTLLAGTMPEDITQKGTSLSTYANSIVNWIEVCLMPHETPEQQEARKIAAEPLVAMGFNNGWLQTLLDRYCERRLYVTDSGYMGLGFHEIKEGDVIAVLVGMTLPCVLRPRHGELEGSYAFVGEAYCHGMMEGEPLKDILSAEGDGLRGQEFVLR